MTMKARIQVLLEYFGWSQRILAKQARLAPSSVRRLLSDGSIVKLATVESIARGFGLTLHEFLSDDPTRFCSSQNILAKRVSEMSPSQCAIVLKLIDAMDRMAKDQ